MLRRIAVIQAFERGSAMTQLFTILVCLFSVESFADVEKQIEKEKSQVSPEAIKEMDALIERNDAKACWEFATAMSKKHPHPDWNIHLFKQYPQLRKCALMHAKELWEAVKNDDGKSLWFSLQLASLCIGNDGCEQLGRGEIKYSELISEIKNEFYKAFRKSDISGMYDQVSACFRIAGGAECDKLEAVQTAKVEKMQQEYEKRQEAEAAKQAKDEAAEKAREEKAVKEKIKAWHAKYLANALRFAKQKVLDNLYTPDRVKWVSMSELVGFGEDYIFHAVYDALNGYGIYRRHSSCVFINLVQEDPKEVAGSALHECPRDRKAALRVVYEGLKKEQERRESESAE